MDGWKTTFILGKAFFKGRANCSSQGSVSHLTENDEGLEGVYLGGGNSNIVYFHPDPWGNDPIWRAYFRMGWFNHQLDINCFSCNSLDDASVEAIEQLPPRLSVGIPLQATRSSTVEGDPSHTQSLVKTNAKQYQSIAYSLKTSKYDNGKSPFINRRYTIHLQFVGFFQPDMLVFGGVLYMEVWKWSLCPSIRGPGGILAHRTSEDDGLGCTITKNAKYLGSMVHHSQKMSQDP